MSDQTASQTIPADAKTFIDGVLRGIGAPVNNANEQAMLDWLANEQGGPNLPEFPKDQGNPLGVQTAGGSLAGATGNVQSGIDSTVNTLLGSNYTNLVAAFRTGDSTLGIDQQIVASPWNGAHYGGIRQFLKTAGVAAPTGAVFSTVPPAPGATNEQVVEANSAPGCSAKGNVFGEGGVLGIGSFSFTYCELKALTGGFLMAAGATIIVIGMSTLIIGGLGTKPLTYLGGVTGVGRVTGAVSARRQRRRSSPETEQSETEEPAEAA